MLNKVDGGELRSYKARSRLSQPRLRNLKEVRQDSFDLLRGL